MPEAVTAVPSSWTSVPSTSVIGVASPSARADEATGAGPGVGVVLAGDGAGDERGDVALGLLHQAGRAAGQVGAELRRPGRDPLHVDHVDVGPLAGGEDAAVVEA